MSLGINVSVNLVKENMCGFGIVIASYLFRKDLLPPSGELSVKENISMNDARGWGGWDRGKDGG